jgi:hypothetical protein
LADCVPFFADFLSAIAKHLLWTAQHSSWMRIMAQPREVAQALRLGGSAGHLRDRAA